MDLEYEKGVLFVRLKGKLDSKKANKINNYLIPLILKHDIKYLIYNLEYTINIDCTGIDALLNSKCAIKTNKGKIYFCKVNRRLEKILKSLNIKILSNEKNALNLIEA